MGNIIKSFQFEAENIQLNIFIKKEVYKNCLKMYVDAEVIIQNNKEIQKHHSTNGTSKDLTLSFRDYKFFWISVNDWKGLRWDDYKNETGFRTYSSLSQMKESYIELVEFIPLISSYFYESVNKYKQMKLLFEIELNEIIVEEN